MREEEKEDGPIVRRGVIFWREKEKERGEVDSRDEYLAESRKEEQSHASHITNIIINWI